MSPPDLPPYTVRVSKRAMRVILKIAPNLGLEVIIPDGFDRCRIPDILDQKRQWIRKNYQRLCSGCLHKSALPQSIHLEAIGKDIAVQYVHEEGPHVCLNEVSDGLIIIQGNTANPKSCAELLKAWMKEIARRHLHAWAEELAAKMKITFRRMQVRTQRSRWGSFSSNGTLSLNCKLLFLPPDLVHYTIIHELCHAVHLNHSAQFWRLVSIHCPHYEAMEGRLVDAQKDIPPWAE